MGEAPCRFRTTERASPVIDVNVYELRLRLRLTQQQFADRFQINIATLRQWEQGRCDPSGASRVLLAVIWHAPDVVDEALRTS